MLGESFDDLQINTPMTCLTWCQIYVTDASVDVSHSQCDGPVHGQLIHSILMFFAVISCLSYAANASNCVTTKHELASQGYCSDDTNHYSYVVNK